jgi:DNA-binding response OmpR family regulator
MIDSCYSSSGEPSTVLLIGNTFGILKRIAYALQHSGHTVIWGDSGKAGLAMAECEEPGLIVSEIDLPDVSGIEICRRVKTSFFADTPVVLVGKISAEGRDSRLAVKAGADDYFVSFSDSQLVLAKLKWLIRRSQTRVNDLGMLDVSEKFDDAEVMIEALALQN